MLKPATKKQQEYLDRAAHYTARAMACYEKNLWHEAAMNFASALESLLLIRYGSGKLAALLRRFDDDALFNDIILHDGSMQKCPTCLGDEIRKLRNAIHPDCWRDARARQLDVDHAKALLLMLYHVLVVCETKVALFQPSPDTLLSLMESEGVVPAKKG